MGSKHKKRFKSTQRDHKQDINAPVSQSNNVKPQSSKHSIWHITPIRVLVLFCIIAFGSFFSSLANPFIGDDKLQIVENVPVHSLTNLPLFFKGSTFYNGHGLAPLTGTYYRPLMVTAFSFIYSLAGPNPTAFHILQLLLHIANAFLIFLVFRYFFKPSLALSLSLIFLVHPANSQSVFSIAALQEPLFFFFGILAFWTLPRFQDRPWWYLIPTSICLLLSMFAKESGILFVFVALLYTFMTEKKRFYPLIALQFLCFVFYVLLRAHAVLPGLASPLAPIDSFNLIARLTNAPAIFSFFVTKALFPFHLAKAYYWAYPRPTLVHFWLPLIFVLALGASMLFTARMLYMRSLMRSLLLFTLFSLWFIAGIAIHLQVIPLDMTACETWLYFPLVGLLGLVGVIVDAYPPRLPKWLLPSIVVALVGIFAVRTAVRGFDWRDSATLAYHDIAISKEDYTSENTIAEDLGRSGDLTGARSHAERSIAIYSSFGGYNTLGNVLIGLGDYSAAHNAYLQGLKHGDSYTIYDNLAALTGGYGSYSDNRKFLRSALEKYPKDPKIWFYLAVLEYRHSNLDSAKVAITYAHEYGQTAVISELYSAIIGNVPIDLEYHPQMSQTLD